MENAEEKIERLLGLLQKDKFNSLSYDEQTEVLNEFIDLSLNNPNGSNKTSFNIGFATTDNETVPMSIKEFIDETGREEFVEILREVVINGGFQTIKVSKEQAEDIFNKVLNNEDLEDSEQIFIDGLESFLRVYSENDINFSTYALLTIMSEFMAQGEIKSEDAKFVRHIEPMENINFIYAFASILTKSNSISKMFNKRGMNKTFTMLEQTTSEFMGMIVPYCKKNDIDPARAFLSLCLMLKIMASALQLDLNSIDDDDIEDYLTEMMKSVIFKTDENEKEIKNILARNTNSEESSNDKDNPSNENSPNGEIKESKSNIDLRKLLMDD